MSRWAGALVGILALLVAASGVSACRAVGKGAASGGGSGPVRVVAAENFYGGLVRDIGGDRVAVTSVLSNPDADPHLFEAGSGVELAVSRAGLVVANGAGYDDWMSKLLAATPSSTRKTLTVARVMGVKGADPNPHLWYDTPKLPALVRAIGSRLATLDPAHASGYRVGVKRTITSLQPLLAAVRNLRAVASGAPVAYTERVPGLLLQAAELRVLTPPSFARAVEDGTDPSPVDVRAMEQLLQRHKVRALLYNEQAVTPVTDRLRQLAQAHGVPVVPVTETQPSGRSFVDWQVAQVRALESAVGSR